MSLQEHVISGKQVSTVPEQGQLASCQNWAEFHWVHTLSKQELLLPCGLRTGQDSQRSGLSSHALALSRLCLADRYFLLTICFPDQKQRSQLPLPKPDDTEGWDVTSLIIRSQVANRHPVTGKDFKTRGHIQWYKNIGLKACHHPDWDPAVIGKKKKKKRKRRETHLACFRIL